jgi:predicted LPLAT superfamily acyltransferase
MIAAEVRRQEWLARAERGVMPLMRLLVWTSLRLGRSATRPLLYPICLYFEIVSWRSREASRAYLTRALGRPAGLGDVFRHYLTFAACVLDRVFLLNDQAGPFDLRVEGEEIVVEAVRRNEGCFLVGAHLGSFEILRALGRRQRDVRMSLVMYEENARKINAVLNAINPRLAMDVIPLGRSDSMMRVRDSLDEGRFVGVLADRSIDGEDVARRPFLGDPAAFPLGPFRMAAIAKRPLVLMIGLYRGGRRYDVFFERLVDASEWSAGPRADLIEKALRHYVVRLEYYCRLAPYNWFNFFDFWK